MGRDLRFALITMLPFAYGSPGGVRDAYAQSKRFARESYRFHGDIPIGIIL